MNGALASGETINRTRPMLRTDLVSPPAAYEYMRDDLAPKVMFITCAALLGRGLGIAWDCISHHSAIAGVGAAAATAGAAAHAHHTAEHDATADDASSEHDVPKPEFADHAPAEGSNYTDLPTVHGHDVSHVGRNSHGLMSPLKAFNDCSTHGARQPIGCLLPEKIHNETPLTDGAGTDSDACGVNAPPPLSSHGLKTSVQDLNATDYVMGAICGTAGGIALVGVTRGVILPELEHVQHDIATRVANARGTDGPGPRPQHRSLIYG